MVKIFFAPEFLPNAKAHTESLIRQVELLFPSWVQEIYVNWSECDGASASIELDFNYRRASITFHRHLFDESAEYQFQTMLHEVLHCYNVPIADLAHEVLKRMFPQGEDDPNDIIREVYHMWDKQLTEVVERANVDFTFAMTRYIEELKNGLGFSPLTGEIAAIGVLDHNKNEIGRAHV